MSATTHPIDSWIRDVGKSDTIPLALAVLKDRGCEIVYDAGCGNGELLLQLCRSPKMPMIHAYGSDIEPGHIQLAGERLESVIFAHVDIRVADACNYQPDASRDLDAVTALGWLHNHWGSNHATGIERLPFNPAYLRQALRTFHDILRPGGIFIWDWPRPDQCARGLDTPMRDMVLERFASIDERRDPERDLAVFVATKA